MIKKVILDLPENLIQKLAVEEERTGLARTSLIKVCIDRYFELKK